jgi:hypothetical protein
MAMTKKEIEKREYSLKYSSQVLVMPPSDDKPEGETTDMPTKPESPYPSP